MLAHDDASPSCFKLQALNSKLQAPNSQVSLHYWLSVSLNQAVTTQTRIALLPFLCSAMPVDPADKCDKVPKLLPPDGRRPQPPLRTHQWRSMAIIERNRQSTANANTQRANQILKDSEPSCYFGIYSLPEAKKDSRRACLCMEPADAKELHQAVVKTSNTPARATWIVIVESAAPAVRR